MVRGEGPHEWTSDPSLEGREEEVQVEAGC